MQTTRANSKKFQKATEKSIRIQKQQGQSISKINKWPKKLDEKFNSISSKQLIQLVKDILVEDHVDKQSTALKKISKITT